MAIAILFTPQSMNAAQYDDVIQQLEKAGAAKPKGRQYHACYGTGDRMRVLDIWDSKESFELFGRTLMPILERAGINPGQPEILPLHKTIL
jgi:hypothetical protein